MFAGMLVTAHCGDTAGTAGGGTADGNTKSTTSLPGDTSSVSPSGTACSNVSGSTAPWLPAFSNPVIDAEFADPSVLTDANRYFAYGTNAGSFNVQAAQSNDLIHWSAVYDALPVLPSWAQTGATWAPDARAVGASRLLWFTAQMRNTSTPCIDVATRAAGNPTFTASSSAPKVCQTDLGGSLDPATFLDTDGTLYLVWRTSGTNSSASAVFIQPLSADGLTLAGAATQLFSATLAWESAGVYAPFLWRHGDGYIMFYGTAGAVGYATATSPLGPYTKNREPMFESQSGAGPIVNPGGPSVISTLDGNEWLAFHSYNSTALNYRSLSISRIVWSGTTPLVEPSYFVTQAGPATQEPTIVSAGYSNPVINADFPDPAIMRVGATYYAYGTNVQGINMQVAQSDDMVHWSIPVEALPSLPSWAASPTNLTWAPDVHAVGEQYVMFFTTRGANQATQCIGVATSSTPQGPFSSSAAQPLICQTTMGGSIDASGFVDSDGSQYVVWKNDGNSVGQDTWIWVQPLDASATVLQGSATSLFKQTLGFEDTLVEAPFMRKKNGMYYIFYSGNSYESDAYFINYAYGAAVTGPYTKSPAPIGASGNSHGLVIGPGGLSWVESPDGHAWAVYHQWNNESLQYRSMSISPIDFSGPLPTLIVTLGIPLNGPQTNPLP